MTTTIVGFGRFGRTLFRLLKSIPNLDINIYIRDTAQTTSLAEETGAEFFADPQKIYESETVFYCVPISQFESVIQQHRQYFRNNLLIDVLSVKSHPAKVFERELSGSNSRYLLTHPMFGPDSSKNGFAGLPLVIDRGTATEAEYKFWTGNFQSLGLSLVEMSPLIHDKYAAYSQGLAHMFGRILAEINFRSTPIDTMGAKKLYEVMEQTCSDTWQLFEDLQNYNPYTAQMRADLLAAFRKIDSHLQ